MAERYEGSVANPGDLANPAMGADRFGRVRLVEADHTKVVDALDGIQATLDRTNELLEAILATL